MLFPNIRSHSQVWGIRMWTHLLGDHHSYGWPTWPWKRNMMINYIRNETGKRKFKNDLCGFRASPHTSTLWILKLLASPYDWKENNCKATGLETLYLIFHLVTSWITKDCKAFCVYMRLLLCCNPALAIYIYSVQPIKPLLST